MSTLANLIFVALIVAAIPMVAASQDAQGIIIGSKDVTQIVENHEDTFIKHADIKNSQTNLVTIEGPAQSSPDISYLSIDNVDESILMFPGEVLAYPTNGDMTFSISSAVPIAVYAISGDGITDKMLLESSESMLTYDPVYHRFEHGIIVPTSVFPHFTTRCMFSPITPGYVVLDNRYFPEYSLVSIQTIS